MTAVTYGAHTATETAKPVAKKVEGKGFFARFFESMMEARMNQARRELALHRHLLPADFEIASHKISARTEDNLPFVR
jgi:hypothetical protein